MPQHKVLLTGRYCAPHLEPLQSKLGANWVCNLWKPEEGEEKLNRLMAQCEVLISGADALLSGKLLPSIRNATKLKLLQIPFSGHDWLKPNTLPKHCLACNVYEHHTTIAEYILAAMLEWVIGFRRIEQEFRSNCWTYGGSSVSGIKHGEINGKTLGIYGYGRIGREVAKRACAFNMKVIAISRSQAKTDLPLQWHGGEERFGDLLAESDYLLLTCPLTNKTKGLINTQALTCMKSSAVLINVARGPVAVEADLYNALQGRLIAGAILDVWYNYPKSLEAPLAPSQYDFAGLSNVIMTPHCAAWTHEQDNRRWLQIYDNIIRLEAGKPLTNIVSSD